MARLNKEEAWNLEAAELMARNGYSLVAAVSEMGLDITSEVCEKVVRRRVLTSYFGLLAQVQQSAS